MCEYGKIEFFVVCMCQWLSVDKDFCNIYNILIYACGNI